MISVKVHNGDVDKALKVLNSKLIKSGLFRELRERQAFKKPSVRKREQRLRARRKRKLEQTERKKNNVLEYKS